MVEVKKLSNGIRVVLEQLPYFRTVSIGVWIQVGSAYETKENNGIAHMIEHMLFKGTTTKTAKQIADIISRIGDDVNAFTGKEVTSFYGTTITKHLPVLVDLLGDMLNNSIFDEKDIRKEKRVICDEIDMYEDSAEDLVHEVLQQKVWDHHPLGFIISGTKANVRSFTREQLLSFVERHYIAEEITISVAGNFEKDLLLGQLEDAFGCTKQRRKEDSIKANLVANRIKQTMAKELELAPYSKKYEYKKIDKPVYKKVFCTRHKEIEQMHINIAFPSICLRDEQRYVGMLFNSILGGSNNSKLFHTIREELGLVYSIYSYTSPYEEAGLFQIDITVNSDNATHVYEKTMEVIEELIANGISQEEFLTYKEQVMTELIMSNESMKAKMNGNAKNIMVEGSVELIEDILNRLDKVTLEEVLLFAKKTLDISNCSVCVVGPKKSDAFHTIKKRWLTYEKTLRIDNKE